MWVCKSIMTASMRYRQPWGSSEVNRLYSEYELRQLPILDIAKLHKRGEHAILHRLAKEGLILETWSDVRGWKGNQVQDLKATVVSPRVNTVFFSDDESLEDNDDPNDEDYVYESDEDDEDDFSVVDSDAEAEEQDNGNESDSDYEDEVESVESDSDYEDEADAKDEDYDPYSIKQKARFMHNIISALKFFVYAA